MTSWKRPCSRISFKHLYHSYLSTFFISAGVPNGEFPEILIAKCRSRFYCTWFFCWREIVREEKVCAEVVGTSVGENHRWVRFHRIFVYTCKQSNIMCSCVWPHGNGLVGFYSLQKLLKFMFFLLFLIFFVGGRSCGRLMSPAHETQSMREIRLLRRRLPRKGGGLTGMID
jgi:hypothetical protein